MKKILFVLLAVILVACRKDVKINNNLWKGGGDWKISSYSYGYGPIGSAELGYYPDCGNFKFSKDGSGTMTMTIDGETEAIAFKYSNTENDLTIVYDNSNAVIYKLDWSKDVMTLDYNEDSADFWDHEAFTLAKK